MTVDGKSSMKGSLLTYLLVAFSRFFWLDCLRPQGVLLHRFPPLKPCANEFSLSLCPLVILDIDATLKHNERKTMACAQGLSGGK
jgi:hypothetical protein